MTDTSHPSFVTPVELSFPPAERLGAQVEYHHYLPHDKLYVVGVYFVGQAPGQAAIDRVLRECLALAAGHDGRFNIHADAYLLAHAQADKDACQHLRPYGEDHFLCFDADLRQIGVRRHGKKHFEQARGVTEVGTVGTGDGLEHPSRPFHPLFDDEDMDEDLDDATDDMRSMVREWVWYGYDGAEQIDRWIDANAADGDGFDVAWIKAFAAALLAKKRAAEATWPEETDCDRLDRAFDALNEQGICALQCAGNTLDDGFEAVGNAINADDVPEDRFMGFCFFHSQDLDRALGGDGLMLAFGHLDSQDAADFVAVGRKVCEVMAQHGLQTEWNGSDNSRINLPGLRWQRRTPT
jgi:hypothetical protein